MKLLHPVITVVLVAVTIISGLLATLLGCLGVLLGVKQTMGTGAFLLLLVAIVVNLLCAASTFVLFLDYKRRLTNPR